LVWAGQRRELARRSCMGHVCQTCCCIMYCVPDQWPRFCSDPRVCSALLGLLLLLLQVMLWEHRKAGMDLRVRPVKSSELPAWITQAAAAAMTGRTSSSNGEQQPEDGNGQQGASTHEVLLLCWPTVAQVLASKRRHECSHLLGCHADCTAWYACSRQLTVTPRTEKTCVCCTVPHAGSPDRKRKREEGEEQAGDGQQQDSGPADSPKKVKQQQQQQQQPEQQEAPAGVPLGLGAAGKAAPPGLSGAGLPPGLPPKGPAAASAAAGKKGGPTAADLAAVKQEAAVAAKAGAGSAAGTGAEPETQQQHQQLARVKQEVKQEARMSRNNSDLTLGISSDQEANVGLLICLLHCIQHCSQHWFCLHEATVRGFCSCPSAQLARAVHVCLSRWFACHPLACVAVCGYCVCTTSPCRLCPAEALRVPWMWTALLPSGSLSWAACLGSCLSGRLLTMGSRHSRAAASSSSRRQGRLGRFVWRQVQQVQCDLSEKQDACRPEAKYVQPLCAACVTVWSAAALCVYLLASDRPPAPAPACCAVAAAAAACASAAACMCRSRASVCAAVTVWGA
jgi:hypothetical protein